MQNSYVKYSLRWLLFLIVEEIKRIFPAGCMGSMGQVVVFQCEASICNTRLDVEVDAVHVQFAISCPLNYLPMAWIEEVEVERRRAQQPTLVKGPTDDYTASVIPFDKAQPEPNTITLQAWSYWASTCLYVSTIQAHRNDLKSGAFEVSVVKGGASYPLNIHLIGTYFLDW